MSSKELSRIDSGRVEKIKEDWKRKMSEDYSCVDCVNFDSFDYGDAHCLFHDLWRNGGCGFEDYTVFEHIVYNPINCKGFKICVSPKESETL